MDTTMPGPMYRSHHMHERNSVLIDLENKIQSFADGAQRDEAKLKLLQEIWSCIESSFTTSQYEKVVEKLILAFLAVFCNTSPQFISENNTQQLRKLMLEIILRLSNVEAAKLHSKDIIKQMMRLISCENEENACLAIKIVTDQGRSTGKMTYSGEVSQMMMSFKRMIVDLTVSGRTIEMFLVKEHSSPPENMTHEEAIAEYLKTCYYSQSVVLYEKEGTKSIFNMIPSAQQSIKVLLEIPYLVVFFYQHFKTSVQTEALDFMRLGLDFFNVQVPPKNSNANFNQTLSDDFVSAQSKFLSFVNIMAKIPAFMDLIMQNGSLLVSGTMQMLERCPPDLITVRREVLMALKYFTSGEMKTKFFPMLPRLISEHVVLGTGFTAIDHLRVFMYQMLADLLHHMRNSIDYEMISHVTYVFCRTLHDPTNSAQVQIMSARLLNSLAESLAKMDGHDTTRELLIDILESHVAKLKVIAVYHMPILFEQYGTEIDYEYKNYERDGEKPGFNIPKVTIKGVPKRRIRRLSIDSVEELEFLTPEQAAAQDESNKLPPPTKENTKLTSPGAILNNMSVMPSPPLPLADARNLVKYIMHTCKFVTGQLRASRSPTEMYHSAVERDLFERLLRYGVMCMDVFVLPTNRHQVQSPSAMRTKDEKETLESLANVFTTIDHALFREIFEKYMDFLIERIYNRNYPLQLMVNTFLVRNEVPFFAATMLSFLMSRMKLLEQGNDKTTLYVKLFKIIFSAIGSNSATHGDKMLVSYLPEILKQSTVFVLTAREPLNYFLLLRSLFRSIGGGAQDILYGKFLQLLPNLLQFLNKLTSSQHRIQMRELFVELCLTVPVRLSSLLPYLPLLMDPLVCAMHGSPGIVIQGLRTLELCVDNLQPEYLLENMMPVRGALMQGLWRVVSKSADDESMSTAFRILGKFGGANRKLLNQPQLIPVAAAADQFQSFLNMEFSRLGYDGKYSLHLPISDLMKLATDQLRYPADMQVSPNPSVPPSAQMKKWCMELSKAVLLAGFGSTDSAIQPNMDLPKRLKKIFTQSDVNHRPTEVYMCMNKQDRELYINALLAMAYGIWNKDGFRQSYCKFYVKVLRQFVLIGVLEYVGGNAWMRHAEDQGVLSHCLDSSIMIDALIICLSETSSTFVFAGVMSLRHINETVALTLPDVNQMSMVPMCRYLMEKILKLCHGPAWYARMGGVTALNYMIDSFPRKFVMDFVVEVVDSVTEAMLGTVEEISSGSADLAFECLRKMMNTYFFKEPEKSEENLTLAAIFMAVFGKHYFFSNDRVREFMCGLVECCMKTSQLEPTLEKFMFRFKHFFVLEMDRIIETAPTMSLADAMGSLAAVHTYMTKCPTGYDFEKDIVMYKRFLAYLLDIAQTDTFTINQRSGFKKCETCPSHFLPPFPITTHIDSMRANALKCLVVAYDRMKKQYEASLDESDMDIEQTEEAMIEILALRSQKITIEQVFESKETWRRLMTVLLRAETDLDNPDISLKLHGALLKVAPIPTNIIATFGATQIRNINRANDESLRDDEKNISYSDIAKFKILMELNPKILGRNMAQNLTNQVARYKMSEKICHVLQVPKEATEAEAEEYELEKQKGVKELDTIGYAVEMLAASPMTTLTDGMVIDIAKFAAHFEYTYSQDVLANWIVNVAIILSKSPAEVWNFFLSRESIKDVARRSLIRRIIVYKESEPLRQEFINNSAYLDRILDMEAEDWKDEEEWQTWDREMFALSLIDRISRNCIQWLVQSTSPIPKLKDLFIHSEFKTRYVVRAPNGEDTKRIIVGRMTEHKYKVPKLFINIFIRYLRLNIYDYQLFFDVVSVFIGNFVTDFSFVREWLETEVIPTMPLNWRREMFNHIMEMFETDPQKSVNDMGIVKALQYLVIPSLQWAFERYDTDEIVGTAPIDDSETSMDTETSANLVGRLVMVINEQRQRLSDGMVIVFYQLCTLFVQHAAEHIHNNNCKKQGGRLRIFMLFAWPCLTPNSHQDPTMRFTGLFFLSNIIHQFTINRKIVLQVFTCLTTTYQQDVRDQIRKAIDILTPAVKARMEDAHQQIVGNVKKILIEECHTLAHVQHIFQMVTRNYRVYYHVRHELLTPLLCAVQRALSMPNSILENWLTRRHAIEICEMAVKWEMFRLLPSDHVITDDEAEEVDRQFERLRTCNSAERFDFEETQSKRDLPDSQRTIGKEHVDTIVNMLVRFCITFHQNQTNGTSSYAQAQELTKRSQHLLRITLRGSIWGDFAHIRTSMIDKYLTITPESLMRNDSGVQMHQAQLQNAQYTLEMLAFVIMVMPKQTLMGLFRPLQRSFISSLSSGTQPLVRHATHIVSRLFEKTNISQNGLDELETINQFMIKFLLDQFNQFIKTVNAQVLGIVGAYSLLRVICQHEPAYLDNVLTPFLRTIERAVKEHINHVQSGHESLISKNTADLLVVCLELIRPRIEYMGVEMKRMIIANIMSDLIVKTCSEKILITCVKLLGLLLTPNDLDFTVNGVLPHFVRMQAVIISKFSHCKDLVAEFLVINLKIFESAEYRTTDIAYRLWEGFFWGLKSGDAQTRENFSQVWEMTWPHMSTIDMVHRMKFIMQYQDWSKFKHSFWLKYALWSMLRSVTKKPADSKTKRKKIMMLNCASPWKTMEFAARLREPMAEMEEPKIEEPEPMDESEMPKEGGNQKLTLDQLLKEQQELMEEAVTFDFADVLDTVSQINFGVSDTKVTDKMWVALFKSFWASLTPSEIEEFTALMIPFLSSGIHNSYKSGMGDSVLAIWLDTIGELVNLPANLIEFISTKHECWHIGIRLLENKVWRIPKQLNNSLLRDVSPPQHLTGDIDVLESLGALYKELSEFDQYAGVWERRSVFPDTMKAMSAIQLGDMEHAATLLESTMGHNYDLLAPTINPNGTSNAEKHVGPVIDKEYDHWMDMYVASCSELLQWQTVADVCNSKEIQNVRGLITAAAHMPDWAVVEECKNQISGCIPPDFYLDYTTYNLMSTVMRINENGSLVSPQANRDKCKTALQECIDAHIGKWRALPQIVSYAHVKILQQMNLIREIEESTEIRLALLESSKQDPQLMTEMKSLMKVFRNRTPTAADDMSFVSTWYEWRNQIHAMMLQRFDYWDRIGLNVGGTGGNQSIVPIHSMAQAQLAVAKHAKHLGFHNLTKDLLNKLAALTAIPMMDAQDKVCTYGKTLRDMALTTGEEKLKNELLYEALEVLEDVKIDDLQKDQVATLMYHRANVHSVLEQTHNADVTFSAASQLVDLQNNVTTTGMKLMKNWGHHLYKRFFSTTVCKDTGNTHGRQALACYFVAARVDNDIKARKPIAKILWLAKHLAVCGSNEALNRVIRNQLPTLNLFNWLFWLPQLVTEVRHKPTSNFVLILARMAAAHPLQVFFHIREAVSVESIDAVFKEDYTEEEMSMDISDDVAFANDEPFSRVLKICLKYRPTDIRVFHRVLKELEGMADLWVEKHLRFAISLKDLLFEDFSEQLDAHFNEMGFSEKAKLLINTWKEQLKADHQYYIDTYNLDFLEIRHRRRNIVKKGYVSTETNHLMFEKEISQVFMDPPDMEDEMTFVKTMTSIIAPQLEIHSPEAMRPPIFIRSVLHWVKLLRRRFDRLPKRIPTESSSPYLAHFSHRTGCIEMPYDLFNVIRAKNQNLMASNQTGQYISMLSRFEPNFEVVVKGGKVMRKIYMRGQTGKSTSFYLRKSALEEPTNRVPQLFKHIDHILQTDHESARRHLNAHMPLQMRVGKHSTLYEIVSIQPYAMPSDCSRNYPSSQVEIAHPYDVIITPYNNYQPDDLVMNFYERFAENAASIGQPLPRSAEGPSHVVQKLTESHHIKTIIYDDYVREVVPFGLLHEFLMARYPDAMVYYTMRKQFLHSLAVMSTVEYHCNLTPMAPHQMMLTMNTGILSNPFYRFELAKGRSLQEIQHFGHEVPFRLTPNMSMVVGVAQDGDLLWSMAAASKCLMKKEPEIIMRPLLWDEYANNVESENLVYVCHASNSYVSGVVNKLKNTNSSDAKLKKDDCVSLIARAKDHDNLARMPPTYHPWF